MKLIEERDKKLAERGIFTVEQEIAGRILEYGIYVCSYLIKYIIQK